MIYCPIGFEWDNFLTGNIVQCKRPAFEAAAGNVKM